MTDWIKDNKFAAALLLVAILGLIGTYLFSSKKSEIYDTAKENFDQSASRLQILEGRKPYPNEGNLEDRRKNVVKYRGKVEGLQKALLAFRPKDFDQEITPADFTTRLTKVGETLKEAYASQEIAVPEDWHLGFEVYTNSVPKDEATAYLNYQLSGMEWLYKQLSAARPSALLNVHRSALPVEKGEPMMPEPEKGRGRSAPSKAQKPYFTLPLELTFRGRESSLRQFLTTLAESKKYFFVVRSMRVQNVKFDNPPRSTDIEFEVPAPGGGGDDLFPDFDFEDLPGDDSAPADDGSGDDATPPVDDGEIAPEPGKDEPGGERILGQVLGDEELHVFLQLELILFRDDVELPAVK